MKTSRTVTTLFLALSLIANLLCTTHVDAAQVREKNEEERKLETLIANFGGFQQGYNSQAKRWEYVLKLPSWAEDEKEIPFTMYVRTVTYGEKKFNLLYLYLPVASVESDVKIPSSVLRKLAELNDILFTGNLSVSRNSVFMNGGWVIDNMTDDDLQKYLLLLLDQHAAVLREIEPLFELDGVTLVD